MEFLVTFLIYLAIVAGLFLLFRSILLWFWKVDKQVELLEKNNRLLGNILTELKNDSSEKILKNDSKVENLKDKSDNSKTDLKDKNEYSDEIQELIKNLKNDEMIIEDKETKKISIIDKSKYETDKEFHLNHYYKVIYKND